MTYKEFKDQGGASTEKEFKEKLEGLTENFNRDMCCHLRPEELPVKVVGNRLWIKWR